MSHIRAAPSAGNSLFSADGKHSSSSDDDKGSGDDSKWVVFGGDQSEGSNELVRLRSVSSVCFSQLQAHLLMSSHPYKEDDEEDLRPYRVRPSSSSLSSLSSSSSYILFPHATIHLVQGIYCVWSTTMPGAPSVVLEASGQPTCCSFSGM